MSLKDTMASLFRMAVFIRNASPRDRFAKALSSPSPFDGSFDIAHVQHKHPKFDVETRHWLRDRLGKAITQRRQFLRYAREHRNKLAEEPTDLWKPVTDDELRPVAQVQITRTTKTNVTGGISVSAPTAASTLLLKEMPVMLEDSHDNQSQTSYALSTGDNKEEQIQLPQLSDVSQGRLVFECPLCWTMQEISKESTWRKHVFSDLRPYLCTFESCDLKLFADRKVWFDHELSQHRAQWLCPFCKQNHFRTIEAFRKHLKSQHAQDTSEAQISAMIEASMLPVDRIPVSECPFCENWETSLRQSNPHIADHEEMVVTPTQYRQHVGAHMQNLALFALPRGYLEGGEADVDSAASVRAGDGHDPLESEAQSQRRSLRRKSERQQHGFHGFMSCIDKMQFPQVTMYGRGILNLPSKGLESKIWLLIIQRLDDNTHRNLLLTSTFFYELVRAALLQWPDLSERWLSRNAFIPILRPFARDINHNDHVDGWEARPVVEKSTKAIIRLQRLWREKIETRKRKEILLGQVAEDVSGPNADVPLWTQRISSEWPLPKLPGFFAAIKPHLKLAYYKLGCYIQVEGYDAYSLGWLIKGEILVSHRNKSVMLSQEPALIGLYSILNSMPQTVSISSQTDCLVVLINKAALIGALEKDVEAAEYLGYDLEMTPETTSSEDLPGTVVESGSSKSRIAEPSADSFGEPEQIS